MFEALVEMLIWLVHLPSQIGGKMQDESRVGQSEWDRETRRYWRRFAWICTLILLIAVLVVPILWRMLLDG